MADRKYRALINYITNWDPQNNTLTFSKEDVQYLEKACSNQVAIHVKVSEDGTLCCPVCDRPARNGYDTFCSGCGQKLSYIAKERSE